MGTVVKMPQLVKQVRLPEVERMGKEPMVYPFRPPIRKVRVESEARQLGLEEALVDIVWAYIEEFLWPKIYLTFNVEPNLIERAGDLQRINEADYRLLISGRCVADLRVELMANELGVSLGCSVIKIYLRDFN